MQITLKQLHTHLKGPLAPIYLLSGETPLLIQESRDAIRQASIQAGYEHFQRLTIEPGFEWTQLIQLTNNHYLFGNQSFIELHNLTGKFDAEAAKILLAYCSQLPTQTILLITTAKLSSAQQKSRWYQAISKIGITLSIWPPKNQELFQWLNNRMLQRGLKPNHAAVQLLAELTEGNLLASQQAIIKLDLLYPQKAIGIQEITTVMHDSAQFTVFALSQYMLQGDARNVVRVLQHLQAEDFEPALVLWLLARECRELLSATSSRQGTVRLNSDQLKNLLSACHETDQIIKGIKPGHAWEALTQISLGLSGNSALAN